MAYVYSMHGLPAPSEGHTVVTLQGEHELWDKPYDSEDAIKARRVNINKNKLEKDAVGEHHKKERNTQFETIVTLTVLNIEVTQELREAEESMGAKRRMRQVWIKVKPLWAENTHIMMMAN